MKWRVPDQQVDQGGLGEQGGCYGSLEETDKGLLMIRIGVSG